jgi:triacylglycerol lipase
MFAAVCGMGTAADEPPMQIPHPDLPPLWRESRIGFELAGLMRSGVWRGDGVADGGGQPVLLVSGLLAGDESLGIMARWLKRTGHRPCRAGIASNVDCSGRAIQRLERRLECLAEDSGSKVAIVGHSRGGSFARVLAVRRPDLVSGVVTLGSPLRNSLDVHPVVRGSLYAIGALGTIGAPGVMRRSCLWGDCCTTFWEQLDADFPAGVGFVSIYSRSDGIVRWRSCLDPAAEQVEVRASHIGMAVNAEVFGAVAQTLEGLQLAEAAKTERRRSRPAGRRHLRIAA